jgi:hypothetical protein
MYHYKARIHSPTLGRFLQTDPVGYDDQVNLYAYVGNDPVNAADSTGLGRLRYFIEAASGVWKEVSGKTARRASQQGKSVEVVGSKYGARKDAYNRATSAHGKGNVIEHSPHASTPANLKGHYESTWPPGRCGAPAVSNQAKNPTSSKANWSIDGSVITGTRTRGSRICPDRKNSC